MTVTPLRLRVSMMRSTSCLTPTSMPRVGSSRISNRGAVASTRPRQTFCWFPPLSLSTVVEGPEALMPMASM